MARKLKLEELAPYLPYGLKIRDIAYPSTFLMKTGNIQISLIDNEYYKPILRLLSDFEKIEEIVDEFSEHDLEQFKISFLLFGKKGWCLNKFDFINYSQMKLMFKYHIDIFGLIEQNLAIDIDTIKE